MFQYFIIYKGTPMIVFSRYNSLAFTIYHPAAEIISITDLGEPE